MLATRSLLANSALLIPAVVLSVSTNASASRAARSNYRGGEAGVFYGEPAKAVRMRTVPPKQRHPRVPLSFLPFVVFVCVLCGVSLRGVMTTHGYHGVSQA
ncbi:hypothetical protein DAQ1742_04292 [Dickeya aquatica]|uniref:Uncharacterized protein n=1 Tax=Dickeya aquatica TaxID=1401087 RepID=A0A375AG26_9GAMM|nr:hypothetical protein DAQ1742_04292 [Dickeya aquatica]